MGAIKRIRDAIRARRAKQFASHLRSCFMGSPLCSDYENLFAQVRPLINELKIVVPYGVGRNGARLPLARTPELAVLQDPCEDMGWAEFADLIFSSWLTEDEVDIHVWRNARGRVDGFTVLPPSTRHDKVNGEVEWRIKVDDEWTTLTSEDVMRIRFSRSPEDPEKGVSPASAVRVWAQIDDLISQYQRAFFENGAIPATLTFVKASTRERFDKKVDDLEKKTKGADNYNKTVYIWRQFDNATGDSQDEIEVKQVQGNNSTMAIKEIVSIVNDRLNKAVGVSNFLLGDDSSAKYSNAELSRYQFMRNRVFPALVSFWSQFQHELDRITGGLGYAIQFDLDLPELTEQLKDKAEVARVRTETLVKLINAGASASAAVQALDLPDNWNSAAQGVYVAKLTGKTADAKKTEKTVVKKTLKSGHHHCHHTLDELPPMTANEKKIYDLLLMLAQGVMSDEPNVDYNTIIEKVMDILRESANAGEVEGAEALRLLANKDVAGEIAAEISKGEVYLSQALDDRIKERADKLIRGYGEYAQDIAKKVLASDKPMTANEIAEALTEALPRSRAELIARNETLYAIRSGRLEQDEKLAEKYHLNVKIIWRCTHDDRTCPVCEAMDGETVALGEAFPEKEVIKDDVVWTWTHSEWNDGGSIPDAHANCRCYFDEALE